MDARFIRGENVEMMNHTPSGAAIAVGQVVIVNDILGICHRPIPDGVLGALAIQGGQYEVNGDAVIAKGVHVYWNDTNNEVTETVGTNKYFGKTVSACAGDNLPCEVTHLQPTSSAAGS